MSIPLFHIGFTMTFSLMMINIVGESFAIIFGGFSLIASILFLLLKRDKTVLIVLLSVVVSCTIFCLKSELVEKPAYKYDGQIIEIKGVVKSIDTISDSGANRCMIKIEEGPLKGYKIRLSSKSYVPTVGDKVSFKGKAYKIDYLQYKDIFLGIYTFGKIDYQSDDEITVTKLIAGFKEYLESEINRLLPDEISGVLISMLIGDKSRLSDEAYESFQDSGVVHLLAVSGFHTSLWSMIIFRSLIKKGINIRISAFISVLFIVLFMGLTGFSASTVRASLMLIVFFLGRMMSRQPDSKNSLGIAAMIIMISNPFSGGDVGFLLSFYSTLGILILYPKINRKNSEILKRIIKNKMVRKRVESFLSPALITFATFIFTFPLIMIFIGKVSLISPISNILITTIASSSILISGLGVVVSKIPILCALEYPLLMIAGLVIKYSLWVSDLLSRLPFATLDISQNFVVIAVAAVIALVGFAFILKVKPKLTALLSMILFTLSIITHYIVEYIELYNYL